MRAALLALLLAGCATLEAGPRRTAENTCTFLFLAAVPVAGTIAAAALCAFGPDELPGHDEERPAVRRPRA